MKKNIIIIILIVLLVFKKDNTNYFRIVTDSYEKFYRIKDNRIECLAEMYYIDESVNHIYSKDYLIISEEEFYKLINNYVWSAENVIFIK